MKATFDELCGKEVINICDGSRLGHIDDLCIDLDCGTILSVTVPSRGRCFGLLGPADERVIPYNKIVKFGDDVILVDTGS